MKTPYFQNILFSKNQNISFSASLYLYPIYSPQKIKHQRPEAKGGGPGYLKAVYSRPKAKAVGIQPPLSRLPLRP